MAYDAVYKFVMRCLYYEKVCPRCGYTRYVSDRHSDDCCDYSCAVTYAMFGPKEAIPFHPGCSLEMFTKEDLERFGGKKK